MKLRKLAALGLAVAMTVTTMAGCGNTEEKGSSNQQSSVQESTSKATESTVVEESNEIVFPLEETLEVECLALQPKDEYPYEENIAWQYVEELTNVKFNLTTFNSADYKEKTNLILSSGDYPEVLYKCADIDTEKYGQDGVLIPLEDLIREYAPNLTALLDETPYGWDTITAADGHVYSLPMFEMARCYSDGNYYWINQSWLDKVGMDMPTNREELYQVLKAFKEKDPNGNGEQDEIPWIVPGAVHVNRLTQIYAYLGEGLYYGGHWMVKDDVLEFLPATEDFKEDLKYFKRLYDEGLINEDAFTMTNDQRKATVQSGDIVGMFYNSTSSIAGSDYEVRKNWFTLKAFDTENWALNTGIQTEGLSITDKCENPETIIAWADMFYTEEGGRIMRLGVEGESYELSADGTTYIPLKDAFESHSYQATLMGASTLPGKIPEIYYLGQDPTANPIESHANNELYGKGYGLNAEGTVLAPITYTDEEKDAVSTISTDINGYVNNYIAETISGITDIDATWNEFQKTLKAMGVDTWIEIRRTAWERSKN